MSENNKNGSEVYTNLLTVAVIGVFAFFWWDLAKQWLVFFVTLGILVAIHEWGHFIAAKAVGVRVYEFALGFGPKVVTYMRRHGTDYTIRAIPLGGFVNPKGMQPDDPITADGLNSKRPAERALVYLAGPLMNVVLAVFVFVLSGAMFGVTDENRNLVFDVKRKSEASQMQVLSVNGQPATGVRPGLRVGDGIIAVNGQPAQAYAEVIAAINPHVGQPIRLTVQRGNDEVVLQGVPQPHNQEMRHALVVQSVPVGTALDLQPGDQIDRINGSLVWADAERRPDEVAAGLLAENEGRPVTVGLWRDGSRYMEVEGIAGPVVAALGPAKRTVGVLGFTPMPGQGERVSLGESAKRGIYSFANFFRMLGQMFSRPKDLGENVGGPIAIFAMLGKVNALPLLFYFAILGSLSLSLAVFNLLPIPLLDGGHMLLVTVESLRRKRLDAVMQQRAQLAGLLIIGTLFVLIIGKDIIKHFG
jgi:regulator of sigma E protease